MYPAKEKEKLGEMKVLKEEILNTILIISWLFWLRLVFHSEE